MHHPVSYFEIPVADLDRAVTFYEAVFETVLTRDAIDGHPMAFFPFVDGAPGATGGLVQGESYVPSHDGSRVYFRVSNLEAALARVHAAGGRTLYPPTDIGAAGRVAEFEDSEGNRVALHEPRKD